MRLPVIQKGDEKWELLSKIVSLKGSEESSGEITPVNNKNA